MESNTSHTTRAFIDMTGVITNGKPVFYNIDGDLVHNGYQPKMNNSTCSINGPQAHHSVSPEEVSINNPNNACNDMCADSTPAPQDNPKLPIAPQIGVQETGSNTELISTLDTNSDTNMIPGTQPSVEHGVKPCVYKGSHASMLDDSEDITISGSNLSNVAGSHFISESSFLASMLNGSKKYVVRDAMLNNVAGDMDRNGPRAGSDRASTPQPIDQESAVPPQDINRDSGSTIEATESSHEYTNTEHLAPLCAGSNNRYKVHDSESSMSSASNPVDEPAAHTGRRTTYTASMFNGAVMKDMTIEGLTNSASSVIDISDIIRIGSITNDAIKSLDATEKDKDYVSTVGDGARIEHTYIRNVSNHAGPTLR